MTFRTWKHTLALALVALLTNTSFGWPPPQKGSTQPTYTFAWLGTLGGVASSPGGINDAGDIWGGSEFTTENLSPLPTSAPFIIWTSGPQAGQMINFRQVLESEGWIQPFNESALTGVIDINIQEINDHGHIVFLAQEIADLEANERHYYTYLYKPASVDTEGAPVPSSLQVVDINTQPVYAATLNNAGVVASVSSANPGVGSYQWSETTGRVYLSNLNYDPRGINLGGSMCGNRWKYTPGIGYTSVFPADVTGPYRSIGDINDTNQLAGTYQKSNISFFYACRVEADGSIKIISMPKKLGSWGAAINKRGDVVGAGNLNGGWRPFVYTDAHGIIDVFGRTVNLPSEIAAIINGNGSADRIGGFDINDAGQIVGYIYFYTADSNYSLAFLLTPNP